MNILFFTLGCKVNQYETEALREAFTLKGYTSDEHLTPNILIINSCSVTAESDRKTRQLLRRLRRKYPDAIIVLTGCMVQAFFEKSSTLSEADIITGNRDISRIIPLVERFIENKTRITEHNEHLSGDKYNTLPISAFNERTRAFMKIEDGCDRFCSYCIIPTARGRVRSRPLSDLKAEAQRLAESGYLEIVLVGINLSAYGKGETFNICDAVESVCEVEGIKRVRLGSLEPDHITDKMLIRLSKLDKFCPQFHLSLQSGCDSTLKRMNRHYDGSFYFDLITRIRNIFSNASITTDIMVGFAGETDAEFKESLDFFNKCNFARAHVFAYSRREGTVAARLPSQVQESEKRKRAHIMGSAAENAEKLFLKSQIGTFQSVLFETFENGFATGYTPNYTRVFIKTDNSLTGQIHTVKLVAIDKDYCVGEIKDLAE